MRAAALNNVIFVLVAALSLSSIMIETTIAFGFLRNEKLKSSPSSIPSWGLGSFPCASRLWGDKGKLQQQQQQRKSPRLTPLTASSSPNNELQEQQSAALSTGSGAAENDNNNNRDQRDTGIVEKLAMQDRRQMVLNSAAVLTSALFAATTGSPSPANAGTLLDDSEKRRIDIFETNAPSVVFIDTFTEKQDVFTPNTLEVPLGSGSGFVWDKEGHIVTNYHVIRQAKVAQVAILTPKKKGVTNEDIDILPPALNEASYDQPIDVFASPSSITRSNMAEIFSNDYRRSVYKATVVGVDPGKDIAILKVNAPPEVLYPINVGTSTGLRVGQQALAIGNPFGLDHTLTVGVISGLGREVKSPIGRPITNVIQSDAAINPGNSGGPLLDSSGKLIGMNTAIYSPSGGSAGIGFAIPVDTVKYIADTLIKDGKVVRPILGISYLESKQARALGIGRGVLVLDVPANSPAAKAGLRGTRRTETGLVEIGDIIVQVGKTAINTEANLFQALEDYKPGDDIDVKVLRIEPKEDKLVQKEMTVTIVLSSSEAINQIYQQQEPLGFR